MTSLNGISAVILAGGEGTRLRPRVSDRPKVLAEIGGRPFLAYLLDQLHTAGIRDVVLSTGYMADMVEQALGNEYRGMRIRYSVEDTPLGTGGGVRNALELIGSDVCLVMNGDSYCGADLTAYAEWFHAAPREAALLLVRMPDTLRYGRVEFGEDGAVSSFVEKGAAAGAGYVNAGIYLLKKSALERIPAGSMMSLEQDIFPGLVGHGLFAWATEAPFIDIGTPESYDRASNFFKSIQDETRE